MELRKIVSSRAVAYHNRTPGLRKLPLPAIAIILAVALANAAAWVAIGVVLVWEWILSARYLSKLILKSYSALPPVRFTPKRLFGGLGTETWIVIFM